MGGRRFRTTARGAGVAPRFTRAGITAALVVALAACGAEHAHDTAAPAARADTRANIVFILADDLGYADIGAFGGEIPTPNLDALARSGMLLTNFYAGMTCSPTRAMLMSGMSNHLSGLGVMGQPNREDQRGQPGYEGYLNFRVASLAELMTDAGYNTYMTGKWHLGEEVETGPRARGFRRSWVSLDGAAHLGPWDWRGPEPARYRDGDEIVYVDDDFYSTRVYTEKMIEYIDQDRGDGRPFFAFLAYTAPHWPLQAPDESIARFSGWYDDGYEALYARRFARQRELGLVPPGAEPIPDTRFNPRWSTLNDEEKAIEARRMEVYAAMVDDLDRYIGEFIDYLKEIGEFENTFIMFASDNGPESTRRDLMPPIRDHIGGAYDHSLENLGRPNSYVMYGPNWASASGSPFFRHKATAFEGGIRVPAFVHFPGQVEEGSRSDETGTVMDLLPTFLALAGAEHPGTSYRGREVLPPQGTSLLPILVGEAGAVRDGEHVFGWELFGHRSVRRGDWKLVWDNAQPPAQRRWRLHDLSVDPFEQNDLSEREPEKYQEMLAAWERHEAENGIIY
jgi:arylsulfatase A-like enzyme